MLQPTKYVNLPYLSHHIKLLRSCVFYNEKKMIDIILTDEIHLSFPQRSSEHMFENVCSHVSSDITV